MATTASPDQDTRDRLNEQYPSWRVWRSYGDGASWYASKRAGAPEEWAPTLVADILAELERQLVAPPERVGKPFAARAER